MARSGNPEEEEEEEEEESEIWGTWEELLLASAVSRHGNDHWDSVAMELRFAAAIPVAGDGGEADDGSPHDIPWLEELRKLRVAELRRDVERSDLSIVSLQLKVKKLKEERERSVREAEDGGEHADPKSRVGAKVSSEPESPPEALAGDRVSGRSCKESNSTEAKEDGAKPDADAANAGDTAGDGKRGGDPIADDRSDVRSSARGDPDPAGPRESGESAAESKGLQTERARAEKESSDVQSSASLTRRRRCVRRRKAPSASSSGGPEEPDADVVSPRPPGRVLGVASQPLVSFLEIVRASKPGCIFERRLESQGSARYRSLIRRHVDLEIVRGKFERSGGAYANTEFFRDLLLLCNNAIVFYPKNSDESISAFQLRELISKEMSANKQPPQPPQATRPPVPAAPKLKTDPDLAGSFLEKSASSGRLIACRKRSSISAKKRDPDRKEEKERPEPDKKEKDAEEQTLRKKTKERSALPPARGFRTNKSRSLGKNANTDSAPNVADAAPEIAAKVEKKSSGAGAGGGSTAKKRSAANFLNRMKRSSPSNGALLESLKNSDTASGGSGRVVEPKVGKGDGRKDQGSRSGAAAAGKQTPEPSASGKRSVGRPPKRAPPPSAKRAREEVDDLKPTPPARKRGRR